MQLEHSKIENSIKSNPLEFFSSLHPSIAPSQTSCDMKGEYIQVVHVV